MKAAETPRPRRRRAAARKSAISTISCSGMRIQKSMGQLEAPARCATVRRDLARDQDGAAAEETGEVAMSVRRSEKDRRGRQRQDGEELVVAVEWQVRHGCTARPSGGRRSSWRTTRRTTAKVGDTRRDRRDAAAEPPQAVGAEAGRRRRSQVQRQTAGRAGGHEPRPAPAAGTGEQP